MKLKNRIIAVGLLVTAVLTLHGCSFAGISDNDLLQPPKATGEKAEIQNLLETTTKGDYMLKYPQSGDYRSAIVMNNIDNDSNDEAIAFYKTSKDNSSINIIFMKKVKDKWETIGSYSNANSDVDRVYFGDVDNDGSKEVIVGWSSYLTGSNQVTMYNYSNDVVGETIVNSDTTYMDMAMFDITNDGTDDLVVLTRAVDEITGETNATARLYSCCLDGKFTKVSEIKTNPNIISYSQILQGNVNEGIKGLFIDGNTANQNEMVTEVLYYSNEKQILISPLSSNLSDNVTLRNTSTVCKDVNEDGIIEVPSPYTPVVASQDFSPCPNTIWYKVNGQNDVTSVLQTVANYSDGFYFVLPESWYENIVATNNNTTRTTSFYEIINIIEEPTEVATKASTDENVVPEVSTDAITESETSEEKIVETSSEPVLILKVFSEKDWKNESATKSAEGYIVLAEESGLVYTCKLGKGVDSKIDLSTEQVTENFKLIK